MLLTVSCHCKAVRFSVDAELTHVTDCNCSTCGRSGFLHWKVPADAVTLLTEKVGLRTYVWRNLNEGHHFCGVCGVAVLRTGYKDRVSVNARCLEDTDVFELAINRYDGRRLMPPGPT